MQSSPSFPTPTAASAGSDPHPRTPDTAPEAPHPPGLSTSSEASRSGQPTSASPAAAPEASLAKGDASPDSGRGQSTRARHLLFAIAQGLHANGYQTSETVRVIHALGRRLGLDVTLMPRWGEIIMRTDLPDERRKRRNQAAHIVDLAPCTPAHVAMNRVAAYLSLAERASLETLDRDLRSVAAIQRMGVTPLWLFILACIGGALGMALIFGARRPEALAMIAFSAGLGGYLRRKLGHAGAGVVWQVGVAALLAGAVGALADRWGFTSRMHLVALCPAMIMVPGPAILNGLMDMAAVRTSLGLARLGYAATVLVTISAGLLLGLALGDVSLQLQPLARTVPLWIDVLASGLAAICFGLFFSMPLHSLALAGSVGMAAHALHWMSKSIWDLSPAAAIGLACTVVSCVIAPVARRMNLPFAGIGFAAVVSMVPGSLIFRISSALVQLRQPEVDPLPLIIGTLSQAVGVAEILLAMALGLIVPKRIFDEWHDRHSAL